MATSKDFIVKNGIVVLGNSSLQSTSTTTGAIVTPGGVGIGGNATIGGKVTINSGVVSSPSWTTNGISFIQKAATFLDTTLPASSIPSMYVNLFDAQTVSATNVINVTALYGTYFKNPIKGTNVGGATYALGADAINATNISLNGSLTASGTATVGGSPNTTLHSLGYGATTAGNTKTVNVGTGGLSSSTTIVTVGSSTTGSTSTINLNGNIVIASGSKNSAAWTTNGIAIVQSAGTWTDVTSSGTIPTVYINNFAAATMSANNVTTVTNMYGTYFKDPVAGTNVTLSNKYAVGADSANITTLNVGGTFSSLAQLLLYGSAANTNVLFTFQTSGALYVGGSNATGAIYFGQSTNSQTTNIQSGATTAGNIKTINIGTGGLSGSTTIVNIGTTSSTSTIVLSGTVTATSLTVTSLSAMSISTPVASVSSLTVSKLIADPVATIVNTSPITLDSFSTSLYRSAKYFVSISNTVTNQYQTSEIWLIQDGESASIEQTSVFSSGTDVVSFSTLVSTGTVSLIATGSNPNNSIKVSSTYITV